MSIDTMVIYPSQVDAFKEQAISFLDNLKEMDKVSISRFKGLDLVAQCFGHKNYSSLLQVSKFHKQQDKHEPLSMFSSDGWIPRFNQVFVIEHQLVSETVVVCAGSCINTMQGMLSGVDKYFNIPKPRKGLSDVFISLVRDAWEKSSETGTLKVAKKRPDTAVCSLDFPDFNLEDPSQFSVNVIDNMSRESLLVYLYEITKCNLAERDKREGFDIVLQCLLEIFDKAKSMCMKVTLGTLVFWLDNFAVMSKQNWLDEEVRELIANTCKHYLNTVNALSASIKRNCHADSVYDGQSNITTMLLDEYGNSEEAIRTRKGVAKLINEYDKSRIPKSKKPVVTLDFSSAPHVVYQIFSQHPAIQNSIKELQFLGMEVEVFLPPDTDAKDVNWSIRVMVDGWAKVNMDDGQVQSWTFLKDWFLKFYDTGRVSVSERINHHYWHYIVVQRFDDYNFRDSVSNEDRKIFEVLKIGNTLNPFTQGDPDVLAELAKGFADNFWRNNNC